METAPESAPVTDAATTVPVAEPKNAILASDATPHPNGDNRRTADPDPRKASATKEDKELPTFADLKAKVRAKINDKDEEVSVEELLKIYQLERGADQKFKASAETEKRIRAIEAERKSELERLRADPWGALEAQGLNPDELAESRLLDKIRLESMDPHERRAHDLTNENKTLKEKADAWEAQQKEANERLELDRKNKLKLEHVQRIDQDLTSNLKERGLKPTPQVLEAVAQHMLAHLTSRGGNQNITATEALDFVLNQQESDFTGRLESEEVGKLMASLSPKRRDAIRRWFVSQVTDGQTTQRREPTQSRAAEPKRGSTDQFFANLEKKFG